MCACVYLWVLMGACVCVCGLTHVCVCGRSRMRVCGYSKPKGIITQDPGLRGLDLTTKGTGAEPAPSPLEAGVTYGAAERLSRTLPGPRLQGHS